MRGYHANVVGGGGSEGLSHMGHCLLHVASIAFVITSVARAQEVSVGPPVQVGLAWHGHHEFTSIVSDPTDGRHLLICGYRSSPAQNSWQGFVYASHDGGGSWTVALVDSSSHVVSEETCSFGPEGRAYFIAEPWDHYGNPATSPLHFYRSPDRGVTWEGPVVNPWLDYARTAVDNTTGPYRGRVYAFGNTKWRADSDGSISELMISADSGRTLAPRIHVPPRAHDDTLHSNFPERTRVFPDGTIIAAYWTDSGGGGRPTNVPLVGQGVSVVTATAGGRIVHPPRRIARVRSSAGRKAGIPSLDIDMQSPAWRGRAYVVWNDSVGARERILLSWSADDGATWSEPKVIDDSPAPGGAGPDRGSSARAPSVAVNPEGTVGVMWAEQRGACWRFSASTDGARTFRPSFPLNMCPRRHAPGAGYDDDLYAWRQKKPRTVTGDTTVMGFQIILGRTGFSDGGALGMTAGADGVFHPLWKLPDGNGTLWTAAVHVGSVGATPVMDPDLAHLIDVSTHVMPMLTNIHYDTGTGLLFADLALFNADSTRAVEGPVYLEVVDLTPSFGTVMAVGGSVWDMSASLPNGRLSPQAESGPHRVTLRFVEPTHHDVRKASADPRLSITVHAKVFAWRFGVVTSPAARVQLGARPDSGSTTAAARAMLPMMAPEARSHAERYLAASQDSVARATEADWLASHAGGADFVLAVVRTEPIASIRRKVLVHISDAQYVPEKSYWNTNAHADSVLASMIATDPDTNVINRASEVLHRRQSRWVWMGITHALAAVNGPAAGPSDDTRWRVLARLQEEWGQSRFAVTLPGFLRQPPSVFAVPEARGKTHIRVVAFGDFGFDEEMETDAAREGMKVTAWEDTVSAALRTYQRGRPFLFGITLGDNFYPQGMQSPADPTWQRLWDGKYGNLGIPFYASLGNHDWYFADSPAAEILHTAANGSWRFPAQFYTYTAGPAQFFAIDGNNLSARQLAWLKAELERSTARWKIVYGHFPPYATRGQAKDLPPGTPTYVEDSTLAATLVPILRGRADVYIAGHSHTFQMFKPIDGVTYVIAGTGGAPLYAVDPTDPHLYYATATAGFTSLDITASALTVTFVGIDDRPLFAHTLQK